MNKVKFTALSTAAVMALASMTLMVRSESNTYDPENDPLISLSYLNGVFAPTYDGKISDLEAYVDDLEVKAASLEETVLEYSDKIRNLEIRVAELINADEEEPEAGVNAMEAYEVICLSEGELLLAKSPLEIILRSGTANAVSEIANGVNDITNGTELMNEDSVPLYHLLLVPRGNDGRGIRVTSPEAYVMVRGDYEIIE